MPLGSAAPVSVHSILANLDWQQLRHRFHWSPREARVAEMIVLGETHCAIADDLAIAPGTVKTYVERVYRKSAVADVRELAVRVMQT